MLKFKIGDKIIEEKIGNSRFVAIITMNYKNNNADYGYGIAWIYPEFYTSYKSKNNLCNYYNLLIELF